MKRPVVLVYRTLGLGDLLTGVPALRALARAFPEHRKILAVPHSLSELGMHTGAVDEVVATAELAPPDDDRLHRCDVAVNLHGRGPQSHRIALSLEPSRLLAFRHRAVPRSHGGPTWRRREHEVHRWCRMLRHYGIEADPSDLDLEPPDVAVPAQAEGATLIHPGAAFAARRWPAERWAAVARAEMGAGRRVLVTAGPSETELARHVAALTGHPGIARFAGKTDVLQLAALVAAAGRVLCADTGVAHLATALRTPSIVLFGPTSPELWGPPPDRRSHRVLWTGRSGEARGASPDRGLLELEVDDVLEALEVPV